MRVGGIFVYLFLDVTVPGLNRKCVKYNLGGTERGNGKTEGNWQKRRWVKRHKLLADRKVITDALANEHLTDYECYSFCNKKKGGTKRGKKKEDKRKKTRRGRQELRKEEKRVGMSKERWFSRYCFKWLI